MADDDDDDLDAFFDEVSEVEAKAVQEGEEEPKKPSDDSKKDNDDSDIEPPAKRVKTSNPAPMRPKGVVVASSTSVVIPAKEREEKEKRAELEAASQNQPRHQHHSSTLPNAPTLSGRFVAAGPNVGPNTTSTHPSAIGPAFPGHPPNTNPQQQQEQGQQQAGKKKKAAVRMAAGQKWVDESLDEWPDNDFRIFVGNLSNDVTDATLFQHFSKYPSVAKAKVVRHNNNPEKSKGYGFVSFLEATEMARALREMDQTWLASRPIRIKRSDWKERDFKVVKKRQKKEQKQRRY